MAEHITDKLVKALSPPKKGNTIVYDDKVAGFGIRITAAGARAFILNYRTAEGRERRITIGKYGRNLWSVEAARRRAGELKKAIARGDDPLAEKRDARRAPTVADLCERYIEDYLPRKRKSSRREDLSMIARIIKPKLGARKVAAVEHADIDGLHRSLKATPYRANRAAALLSKMFSLAIKWGWRADNPARGVERFPEQKRTRYLSPAELTRLGEALAEYPDQKAANAVRLCLLTGCRRGEALGATWDQFDLEAGIWTKPGSTTKQKTTHRVPLSEAAKALIRDMHAAAQRDEDGNLSSQFLFPGRTNEKHLVELNDEWRALRTAARLEGVRLHDLRHTFASILASAGQSLPLIGALLGHSQPTTTARYAHLFDDPLKKAADTVGAIVTGKAPAEVVPIKRADNG